MISFLEGYIMSGKNQETQYKISNIQIKDGLISWENHTVRSSGISQVWLGELTVKPFPAELFLILCISGYACCVHVDRPGCLCRCVAAVPSYRQRRENGSYEASERRYYFFFSS